jgi:ubiquinone/menaquinone biosynthesis C-methylase UbiE
MPTDKRTVDWYNEYAKDYAKHVRDKNDSVYHAFYEKPAMYNLLPDLKDKKAVSIGCGSGEDCNELQERGADVVGIDISVGLITIAKESYPNCEFHVMDMEELDLPGESFDFAYSSLAIHYLEDWTVALKQAYRILKPGSFYLLSCGHPTNSAMAYTISTDEVSDSMLRRRKDKNKNEVKVTGDYFARRKMNFNEWILWHKSLSEISSEIAAAGFVIELIHEPQPTVEMKEIAPIDYEILTKIPNFLILKLRKL